MAICGNDSFCLFDIAATGNMDIGLSTLDGSLNYETIVEMADPGKKKLSLIVLGKKLNIIIL